MRPDFTEPGEDGTCFKYPFFVCLVVFGLRNFHAERNLMLVFVGRKERNNLVLWPPV